MSIPTLVEDKKKGVVYINPLKRFTSPRWYLPDSGVQPSPWIVTIPGGGNTGNIPINFDEGNGHAELFALVANSEGDFTITVLDQGRKHGWMNRPIHNRTIFGNSNLPFILPSTYFINVERGTRQLTIQMNDLSGQDNDVRLAFLGRAFFHKTATADVRKVIQKKWGVKERILTYMLTTERPVEGVAAGARATGEFVVPSNWPLELKKMTVATDPENTPFEMILKDFSTGRQFAQEGLRIRSDLMWGNSFFPFIPFESFFLPRNWRLTFELWNLGAQDTDFYLTMTGQQIKIPVEKGDHGA